MGRPLVLFHASCADGFCAAWVAREKFGDDADYKPVHYNQDPPKVAGRDVFILDFSYKRPVLEKMIEQADKLVLLDHHKTAEEDLAELNGTSTDRLHVVFDMNKSGARLAWDYFNPDKLKAVHWLVAYVEDRDLWRFKLPQSKTVNAGLSIYPYDFEEWDQIVRGSHLILLRQGQIVERYQKKLVDQAVSSAVEVTIGEHKVLCVNTTCLFSDIAGTLAEGRPFGAVWFRSQNGKYVFSLRSRGDGIDVSEVAKSYGGGGHKQAAGFELDQLPF